MHPVFLPFERRRIVRERSTEFSKEEKNRHARMCGCFSRRLKKPASRQPLALNACGYRVFPQRRMRDAQARPLPQRSNGDWHGTVCKEARKLEFFHSLIALRSSALLHCAYAFGNPHL